jgi:hypothetical protein
MFARVSSTISTECFVGERRHYRMSTKPSQRLATCRAVGYNYEADSRVERSLYQRAVGHSYESVKIFMPAGARNPCTRLTSSTCRPTSPPASIGQRTDEGNYGSGNVAELGRGHAAVAG